MWASNPCAVVEFQRAPAAEAEERWLEHEQGNSYIKVGLPNSSSKEQSSSLPQLQTILKSCTQTSKPVTAPMWEGPSTDEVLPPISPTAWSISRKMRHRSEHAISFLTRYPSSHKHKTSQGKFSCLPDLQCGSTVSSSSSQCWDTTGPFYEKVSSTSLWCYKKMEKGLQILLTT